MKKTIFQSLTAGIITIVLFIVLSFAVIYIIFSIPDKSEDFTTSYGDSFHIYYDSFHVKTAVSDNHSSFDIIVRDKVDKNDIIGLADEDGLKVYKAKDIIFYDEGNGFECFDSDTKNEKVIRLAKDNLSVEKFYSVIDKK